jgi:hypothetical protein
MWALGWDWYYYCAVMFLLFEDNSDLLLQVNSCHVIALVEEKLPSKKSLLVSQLPPQDNSTQCQENLASKETRRIDHSVSGPMFLSITATSDFPFALRPYVFPPKSGSQVSRGLFKVTKLLRGMDWKLYHASLGRTLRTYDYAPRHSTPMSVLTQRYRSKKLHQSLDSQEIEGKMFIIQSLVSFFPLTPRYLMLP